jgi:hypothetical protein
VNVAIATMATTQSDDLLLAAAGEAGCLAHHPLRQRLARWLLALSAGADDGRLVATHQAMADLLGVRRSAITLAAGDLRAVGMVSYHRGHIVIGDRIRLRALACGCGPTYTAAEPGPGLVAQAGNGTHAGTHARREPLAERSARSHRIGTD